MSAQGDQGDSVETGMPDDPDRRGLTPAERRKARRLLAALEEFRGLDPDMQMPMAATLLLVAMHEDISRTEVMNRLGVAGSTATRNLMGLMASGRLGRAGHGLVEQRVNPLERRWRLHRLTPEGEHMVRRLLSALEPEPEPAPDAGPAEPRDGD